MLITRAVWEIKPGGMLRTATLLGLNIKAILEYGPFAMLLSVRLLVCAPRFDSLGAEFQKVFQSVYSQ